MTIEPNSIIKNEIIGLLNRHKKVYGDVLVQSAIAMENSGWTNIFTKVIPLHKKKPHILAQKLDYKKFIYIEEIIHVDELIDILEKLVSENKFTVGGITVQSDDGIYFENVEQRASGDEFLNIGWSSHLYKVRINGRPNMIYGNETLVAANQPLFPNVS